MTWACVIKAHVWLCHFQGHVSWLTWQTVHTQLQQYFSSFTLVKKNYWNPEKLTWQFLSLPGGKWNTKKTFQVLGNIVCMPRLNMQIISGGRFNLKWNQLVRFSKRKKLPYPQVWSWSAKSTLNSCDECNVLRNDSVLHESCLTRHRGCEAICRFPPAEGARV